MQKQTMRFPSKQRNPMALYTVPTAEKISSVVALMALYRQVDTGKPPITSFLKEEKVYFNYITQLVTKKRM